MENEIHDNVIEESAEAPEADANAQLREALKREKARATSYRNELIGARLSEIGLRPDAGLGKAIAKEYDGDLTIEALSEYAREEYAYEGTTDQTPPEVAAGERLNQLESVSEPVTPPQPVDEAAQITAKMDDPESGREDAAASVTAKATQFYQEHYG